jgi:HSP20 family protein
MSLVPWKASSSIPVLRSRMADEIADFQRDINNLTSNFFGAGELGAPLMFDTRFSPAVDVEEKEDKYLLDADMPGLSESDIDLDFHNNTLTIKGEKKSESKKKDADYVRIERSCGSFRRDIPFDETIDQEKIKAELKSGVLHIELAKKEKTKMAHRKIEIKH